MKQTRHNSFWISVLFLIVIIFTSCEIKQGAFVANRNNGNPFIFSRNDIDSFQKYSDLILKKGTREFFLNYPVDENFLAYVTKECGVSTLKNICKNGNFNDSSLWYKYTGNTMHALWVKYCKSCGVYEYSNTKIKESKTHDKTEAVLEFTGDVNLASDVRTVKSLKDNGNDITKCFSNDLLEEMRRADIFSVNNEFCYTTRGEPIKGKDYIFKADPKDVSLLKNIGVDFVNLANNHTYDCGEVGVLDTLDALDTYDMPYVGAGKNFSDAKKPLYYVLNGRKIAFVSATQIERSLNFTKEATENSPGVIKTLNPDKYVDIIKDASTNADIVIAIVHWGTEGNSFYGEDQVKLAHAFVDAGADAIIGCHSHCLQGVEFIDNVPVFYSLGNYWFSLDDEMPDSYKTGIAKLIIGRDGKIIPYFVPCEFNMGVTKLITDKTEYATDLAYLESLSTSARVDSDGRIIAR